VLDAGDLEYAPARDLPATFDPGWPDGRLNRDSGEIEAATSALRSPSLDVTTFRQRMRDVSTAFQKAEGSSEQDILQSSRGAYERYRQAVAAFKGALSSAHASYTMTPAQAQNTLEDLETASKIAQKELGHDLRAPTLRLGAEEGGEDWHVPYFGWVLYHKDGTRTLSIGD
jgi:hypothetical protein